LSIGRSVSDCSIMCQKRVRTAQVDDQQQAAQTVSGSATSSPARQRAVGRIAEDIDERGQEVRAARDAAQEEVED
jgi:hypothetical protein